MCILELTYIQPLPRGYPWAHRTSPKDEVPNTGVFRHYNFDITEGWMMADGVNKTGLYINGQFPGPTIEANWGDTIQVIFVCSALWLWTY